MNSEFDSLYPSSNLTRRGFVAGLAATGFTLAAGPVVAQTAIKTSSDGLSTGNVSIDAKDGKVPAYFARPSSASSNLPVVLVVHEIFGVHEYIRDVCRRLAKVGYLAIAPDLYARFGDASKLTNVQDALALAAKATDPQQMSDLDACRDWAIANGGDSKRLAITGFCRGGRTVWLYAAHQPKLSAGVAWYGTLDGPPSANTPKWPLDLVKEIKAPVLGLYGGADQGISMDEIELMRDGLAKASSKSTIHVYPDAPHAFHADYRPTFRKDEAEDGWKRLLAWFKQHGV